MRIILGAFLASSVWASNKTVSIKCVKKDEVVTIYHDKVDGKCAVSSLIEEKITFLFKDALNIDGCEKEFKRAVSKMKKQGYKCK